MRSIVKKTLEKIVGTGNHYVIKVKGNQPKLKSALEEAVMTARPVDSHREEEIKRGRLEIRETWLYERPDTLAEGWESVLSFAYVRRTFLSKKKEHKTESLYITDRSDLTARDMAEGIRSHWGIENKLHYVKDVIMREDAECTKNKSGAANLALFRDFAFNILKSKNKSVKYASEVFADYSVRELFAILIKT